MAAYYGDAPADALDILEREALDGCVGPVTVGAAEVALVGETDPHGE
jgi:hypothetical protein